MRKSVLKQRLARVGCAFSLSDMPYSINGNPPMYHIQAEHQVYHLENVSVIENFIRTKRAANAAHSPEDAQKIMQEGGF